MSTKIFVKFFFDIWSEKSNGRRGSIDERRDIREEFGGVDGFGDVSLEAGEEGVAAVLGAGEGGESDGGEGGGGVEIADFVDELIAVHFGHADVGDEEVGMEMGETGERFARGGGEGDVGFAFAKETFEEPARVGVVID